MPDITNTAFLDSESAHWYYPDGSPCHTVIGKNGKERSTTIKDARKLGLLPSVTSILSYLANPHLDSWKQRQVLMSALTLPRNPAETEESFALRVIDDSKRQAREAAEWGTNFHLLANAINQKRLPDCFRPDAAWMPYTDAYQAWYNANIVRTIAAETVLVDTELGFAGTCDLIAEHQEYGLILLDYKRQDVKDKPAFYSKWLYQLAAYRHAYKKDWGRCISMVVDCNKPEFHIKVWEDHEVDRGWGVFKSLIKVWQAEKGYQYAG